MVIVATTILSLSSILLFNISNFMKSKKKISFMHILCNICDFALYIIVGGKSGMANSFSNICKNACYVWVKNQKYTVIFSILRIILLAVSGESIYSFMFILLEIVNLLILLKGTAQQLRILSFVRQCVWVIYDYIFASLIVALITFTGCISCFISIITNKEKHNEDE